MPLGDVCLVRRSFSGADADDLLRVGMLLFVVHPASTGSAVDTVPLQTVAVIPARFGSTRFPGKPLAEIDGRPMIEHVYLPREAREERVARHRRHRRPADRDDGDRLRRRGEADARRPSERNGSARGGRRETELRRRRQRAGRRAADRSGRHRRGGRAVYRSRRAHHHPLSAHHRFGRAQESQHRQDRDRPRRVCALFLTRADSVRPRPARRLAADVSDISASTPTGATR